MCEACDERDDGEYFETLSSSQPRARKPHTCYRCGGAIAKGERYQRTTGLLDGVFLSVGQHIGGCDSFEPQADEPRDLRDE